MNAVLDVRGLGKTFGGFTALNGIALTVAPGERLGLVGPNGSGKSTFVNCIAGDFPDHAGVVLFRNRPLAGLKPHERARLGLSRTFQLPRPFRSLTVLENVTVPLRFSVPPLPVADARARARACLERVGLQDKAHSHPHSLTQVDLRKLELARALAPEPALLIADEVMAGLSHSEVDQILDLLFALNGDGTAVIMIEHVMRAITAFSQRLAVFVAGRKIVEGDPQTVLATPEVEAAYLGT
ncbi:ABC transporter ATP-binding protein [Azospirillum sp. RWY-5-1]|uniref:ABC transporter ATP-binding protein n=1 Tax=Azospirillum oleiclasticum TaxID=2735135 RepID=A0ABX2TMX0_9PROT|nr:ABC transporter ATP-binding protein [Azospirillum oleiclasticum]NYZ17629.1 ABC transporter ATP-binding protein [Azospirillum oleiclasticum]NYZ24903.1 ABC transporter ATP-binding protein [Azospirillum oleiclasticum]